MWFLHQKKLITDSENINHESLISQEVWQLFRYKICYYENHLYHFRVYIILMNWIKLYFFESFIQCVLVISTSFFLLMQSLCPFLSTQLYVIKKKTKTFKTKLCSQYILVSMVSLWRVFTLPETTFLVKTLTLYLSS